MERKDAFFGPTRLTMSLTSLNRIFYDLQFPRLQERYRIEPEVFLLDYDLTDEETVALQKFDIRSLWQLGVNPYLLRFSQYWTNTSDEAFLASLEGLAFQGSILKKGRRDG